MSKPHVSLIIPSVLRAIPGTDILWLARAIQSAQGQTLPPKEIIIGLDPGVHLPGSIMALSTEWLPIRQANGDVPGHQAACNAAAARADAPLLAFLEDDDAWTKVHLELLAEVMDRTGAVFVSSSQLEVNPDGSSRGAVFDFPTASGWLLTRLTWIANRWFDPAHGLRSGFDPAFKIVHDNDFLGRLNARKVPRAHVIEGTADVLFRPQLSLIGKHARLIRVDSQPEPTVRRAVNEQGVLGSVGLSKEKQAMMAVEYNWCQRRYGSVENTW